MEYLTNHVKVEMWPGLCKFPILFSAVKLKLGHNFSQFIYRFKINVALGGILNFYQSMEEIKNWDFGILPTFFQFTKQLGNWDLFPCFYVLPDREDCLSGRVYVLGREANSHYVTILWQVKWKHCLQA